MSLIASSVGRSRRRDRQREGRDSDVSANAVEKALEREIRRPLLVSLAIVVIVAAGAGGLGWSAWRSTRLEAVTAANVLADPARYANRRMRVWAVQAFGSNVRSQSATGSNVPQTVREYRIYNTGAASLYVGVPPGATGASVVGRVVRTPDWMLRVFPEVGGWIVESEEAPHVPLALLGAAMAALLGAALFAARSVKRWRNPDLHPGVAALAAFGRADLVLDAVQRELRVVHPAQGVLHLTDHWLVALQPGRVRVLPRAAVKMVHIANGEGADDRTGKGSDRLVVKAQAGRQLELSLGSVARAAAGEQFLVAELRLAQHL